MSRFDDFEDVMAAEIADDLVEELISGAYEPELPAELLLVGRVLRAAHGPIPGEDRAREAEVVEAMITAMRVTPIAAAPRTPSRGRSDHSARGRRRVLVAFTAAVSVLGVGGVAAAAGTLPAPIQSFVHDSLSYVGVSIPSNDTAPSPAEPVPTTVATDAPAPPPSGDASVQSGDAPPQTDGSPGKSGDAPGHSGEAPGQSGEAPGRSGEAPGQSGIAPGQSGEAPGLSGEAPGQSGEAPGHSGEAPGLSKSNAKEGKE